MPAEPTARLPSKPMELLVHGGRMLLAALILSSVVINFSNVVARYVFLSPLFWAEPIINYIMIWCVFLGGALVTLEDKHLNVDIASTAFPEPVKTIVRILGALCLLAVVALVVPQSWDATLLMIERDQRTAIGDLPLVIPHSGLLVGFSLMFLAGVVRLVILLRGVRQPDDPRHHRLEGVETDDFGERPGSGPAGTTAT